MSYGRVYIALVLPFSLVLACTACGHNNKNDTTVSPYGATSTAESPASMTSTPSVAATPLPAPAATSAGTAGNPAMAGQPPQCVPTDVRCQTGASADASNRTAEFKMLAGSKGYISKDDAAHDVWLSNHFAICDTNHNDKISRDEYARCRKATSSAMPQSSASSGMPESAQSSG